MTDTITLKDVARKANVSPTTVSLVVRGIPGRVGEGVRRRVLEVIKELNYVPNVNARRLRTQNSDDLPVTGDVGVVVYGTFEKYKHPFFARLLDSFEAVAVEKGLQVSWTVSEYTLTVPFFASRRLNPEIIDGVLAVALSEKEVADRLASFSRPVVSVNSSMVGGVPVIVSDLFDGGRQAVAHLIDLGHREIGVISQAGSGNRSSHSRQAGARGALMQSGLPVREDWFKQAAALGFETGLKYGAELLSGTERPTAIFAASDLTALGVIRAAAKLGLSIPEDLSVMGFNGDYIGEYVNPPLSTILLDTDAIARVAFDHLEAGMKSRASQKVTSVVPVKLIVRESTSEPSRPPGG